MQLTRSTVNASRGLVTSRVANRRSAIVRARPEKEDRSPISGTVYYGGRTYSEAEYEKLRLEGSLPDKVAGLPVLPVSRAPSNEVTFSDKTPGFTDVMGFSGFAPEIINGRLAMLGFVAAVGAELATGKGVIEQVQQLPGGILAAFLVFITASLIPILFGEKPYDRSSGPLTPKAELINGRVAMLGFAGLLLTEWYMGGAVF